MASVAVGGEFDDATSMKWIVIRLARVDGGGEQDERIGEMLVEKEQSRIKRKAT